MATALGPEGAGVIDEDGVITDTEIENFKTAAFDIVRNGMSSEFAYIIPGVVIIPIEDAIGFSLTPSPDVADLLESQNSTEGIESFETTIVGALEAMASTLDMNIDNPIGKNFGLIDPTVVISTAIAQIAASIEGIMENIEDAVADAKDALGDYLQNFLDGLSEVFAFEMPGLTEILDNLVELLGYIFPHPILPDGHGPDIEGLFGFLGIPTISEMMDKLFNKIYELIVKITTLDIGEDLIDEIVNRLLNFAEIIISTTLENIIEAVTEKITQLIQAIEIPTVFLPPWVYTLPEITGDLFNIDLSWNEFFNLGFLDPPPITLQLYNLFIAIMDWFNNLFTGDIAAFVLGLIDALSKGVAGVVEFIIEIVVGWIATAMGLVAGAVFKIAASVALINRTVRYLAVCLVGKLVGQGLIFDAVAAELLG